MTNIFQSAEQELERLVLDQRQDGIQAQNQETTTTSADEALATDSHLETMGKKQNKSLIGLEYLVEIVDVDNKNPKYVCILCDKKCDAIAVVVHVISHRHKMKYLDLHFPTLMANINKETKFNTNMTYRDQILTQISSTIEAKIGRTKPTVCEIFRYENNKQEIERQITNKQHFSERDWPECVKILLNSLGSLRYQFESEEESSEEEYDDTRLGRFTTTCRRPTRPDQLIQRPRPRVLTQFEMQGLADSRLQETYALEKYKTLVDIEVKKLDKAFSDYVESPEMHPKYTEEWKLFWSRKYKELLSGGKDANGHDYKPEWIEFWAERMKELHEIDITKAKDDLRKRMELSINAVANIEKQIQTRPRPDNKVVHIKEEIKKIPTPPKQPKRSAPVVEDFFESKPTLNTSQLLVSAENSRDYDRGQVELKSSEADAIKDEIEDDPMDIDAPINLISVLRFLTFLRIELGLFADSIFDLLVKATAVEKSKPNAADELLFIKQNLNILETVKEKFKGVLIANLISADRVVLVQRAVQKITELSHEISLRKPSMTTAELQNLTTYMKVEESFDDSVDPKLAAKIQIASIIAEKLMSEGFGKNVSSEELETLIESLVKSSENPTSDDEMEVVAEPEEVKVETATKPEEISDELYTLSNEDLQTLMRNFSELTPEEQAHLLLFLKKIEETDAKRVERLRKFTNMGDVNDSDIEMDMDMD